MKERIKELRKALHMTQAEFGAMIGLGNTAIAGYEIGRRDPSDAVILSICREFGVSEAWLRYGDGAMFPPQTRNERLALLINDVMADQPDSFRQRLFLALADLNTEQWRAAEAFARKLAGLPPDPPEQKTPPQQQKP